MPFSDNMYSMVEDDESEVEPIEGYYADARRDQPAGSTSTPPGSDLVLGRHGARNGADEENIYDAEDEDDDEEVQSNYDHLLSPTDGYFRGSAADPSSATAGLESAGNPLSSNVPYVPNVLVVDPSLEPGSTADSKAREADRERLANSRASSLRSSPAVSETGRFPSNGPADSTGRNGPTATPSQQYHPGSSASASYSSTHATTSTHHAQDRYYSPRFDNYYYPASSASASSSARAAHLPPSSSSFAYAPSAATSYTSYQPRQPPYGRQLSFQYPPSEAPPAYTPSPTSPISPLSATSGQTLRNYQTFSASSSSPASPSPSSSSPSSTSRGLGTSASATSRAAAASMGRHAEAEGLLTHQPESMASPNEEYAGVASPVWRERVRRRLPFFHWRMCKTALLALVLLLITTGFLVSFFSSVAHQVR
jgi:hypothetical protein